MLPRPLSIRRTRAAVVLALVVFAPTLAWAQDPDSSRCAAELAQVPELLKGAKYDEAVSLLKSIPDDCGKVPTAFS